MAPDERHTTAVEDRVPWNQLIAYGMGGVIPIALFNIAPQLIGLLGNISLGLDAFWLGTIMIVPRLWDAFFDPFIGHLSDNSNTRWGRRRPFLLVGGLAAAISFAALWWIPRGEWIQSVFPNEFAYDLFQYAFILTLLVLFFTACAVFEIPHGALGMEMSTDYHERTRLFSAKSFLGNLFAMGTPWLIFFAGLGFFKGSGDLVTGMRYVGLTIAALLIPLTMWLFVTLKEPGIAVAERPKTDFWHDMHQTVTNPIFLSLVIIVFTLAMGFNFVSIFSYYITIFYLYGGDPVAAGPILGINGTVWAVTALVAVVPLNWLGRRFGKSRTLLLSILLMCAAQVAKIFCYNPELPYLVIIPTILLSAGMLMFFTLGSSMVGDVCDEDEVRTGTRSEGMYYSVFWWFIKVGSAFASFVTGLLLVFTGFNANQNVAADALRSNIEVVQTQADTWQAEELNSAARLEKFNESVDAVLKSLGELRVRLQSNSRNSLSEEHAGQLIEHVAVVEKNVAAFRAAGPQLTTDPVALRAEAGKLLLDTVLLKQQSPKTLFRLRLVEIGLPLALSIVSIVLTLRYPLTEARCYEIKEILKQRREASVAR